MKSSRPRRPDADNDELAGLIATLGATERRLAELTGGEVDSVVDADGHTVLLRHAQEQLRHGSAATQAAVLNALPAHVALVDLDGRILSVNEAWRHFGVANALPAPSDTLGFDYLRVCDQVTGADQSDARAAAAGIRSVLGGEAQVFSMEYACDSPDEPRWFLMTVTPLAQERLSGAVVMHLDITERKRQEEELRRFRAAMDAVADAVYVTDRGSMRFVHVNEAACRMQGRTRAQLLAVGPAEVLSIPRADLERTFDAIIAGNRKSDVLEMLRTRQDGSQAWVELRRHAACLAGRWKIVTLVRDVTERRNSDAKLKRLNRVYAVLSGINTLIVRVHDRDELFREACRIATDEGGFLMAMVVFAGKDSTDLGPCATAGVDDALLADIRQILGSPDARRTMVARAIRENTAVVANDSSNDAQVVFGEKYAAAGVRSLAVMPLAVGDEVRGVFCLYSAEAGFFDAEEMRLLTELAGDISFAIDHIEKEELIDYVAYYDPLTGLANRRLFLERVGAWIRGAETGGHGLALFLLDVERFKNVSDSLGRRAGDALLKQIAQWLTRIAGDAKLVARLDADHFAVVLPEVAAGGNLDHLVRKVVGDFMEHPFQLEDAVFRLAVKVGAAVFPADGADPETLFRNAEAALKKAKASGARFLLHTREMTQAVAGKLTLENRLRNAVDREEFVLHYQPKVSLASGLLTSAEALIRWNDPLTGLVPPGRFIPMLEETGLIYDVGRWALAQALRDYARCRAEGLPAVRIAVNVSPLQLRHRDFVDEIAAVVGTDAHAAAGLELEITESVIMEDARHSIASLERIRALGVTVAIDDFGTGFSSLSYLARLPVDTLKIDRSFVVDMTSGPQGLALVSTIIDLAHSLGLKVVAEGVETEEQSRLLALLGCDEMQGFLLSKPLPAELYELRYLAPPAARIHAALAAAPA